MSEMLPKLNLSQGEQDRINAAKEVADPTTYSELSLTGEKVDLGRASAAYDNRLIGNRGETYVRLESGTSDPAQFVTAKLLKGIVNVSDVIRGEDGDYYSKVMPLEKIKQPTSLAEIDADLFVLQAFMHDGDKDFSPASEHQQQYEKNLIHKDGKVAYFDFGFARHVNPAINHAENVGYTEVDALEIAGNKLTALSSRLNGTMGTLFLKAIMKETGCSVSDVFPNLEIDMDEDGEKDILTLQAVLLHNIQEGQSEIQKRIAKQWDKAA